MKSLLVPVNFKPNATNAAHYAADMALALEADIHLLYVLQMPAGTTSIPLPYVMDELRRNGEWLLQELLEDIRRRTGGQVDVVTHIEVGSVEAKIEAYCAGIRPFLVVMGAPEPPPDNFFSGSDTITAVRHLPWPLLVVPGKQQFHAIRTITLACLARDIKEGLPVPFGFVHELKELFAARFEVVHFITGRPGDEKDIRELYYWKQVQGELIPELHFVQTESLEEGLVQYLAGHQTDWLMIFPKKHSLLELHKSRSKMIVTHCPVPVLSIYEDARAALPEENSSYEQLH
jgi:nucleotide-binding universal stress UspA family protein